jgi:hypothetical protein
MGHCYDYSPESSEVRSGRWCPPVSNWTPAVTWGVVRWMRFHWAPRGRSSESAASWTSGACLRMTAATKTSYYPTFRQHQHWHRGYTQNTRTRCEYKPLTMDFGFLRRWKWRQLSSGRWRHVLYWSCPTFQKSVLTPSSGSKSNPYTHPARSKQQATLLHGVTSQKTVTLNLLYLYRTYFRTRGVLFPHSLYASGSELIYRDNFIYFAASIQIR